MEQHSLWFDRYQRFKASADLIDKLAQGRRLSVLDVGSFDNAFEKFLPDHKVIPNTKPILKDKGGLKMPDKAVDLVCALDVLEHVPPLDRSFFLKELARVARLGLVIAFPIISASETENFVCDITMSAWLKEHRLYGLPDPVEVEKRLTGMGLTFERYPNACLPSWAAMMLLMHGVQDRNLKMEISTFFNKNFYKVENREPAYRYIYVCQWNKNT